MGKEIGKKTVDAYLQDGCGRCSRYLTPDCSVHFWGPELALLRQLALEAGLKEEIKWSHPCYTLEGKNIVILGAFREYCVMTFFKGSIMKDPAGLLVFQGENSRIAKSLHVRAREQLDRVIDLVREYLQEAIEIERQGLKVERTEAEDFPIPEELAAAFDESPEFRAAFEALTPGRQRSWLIHFSAAKQAKTRESRIEKAMDLIFVGKGHNEY